MNTSDMTSGSIFRHILRFAVPVALSGILQVAYNSADCVVVGRFVGNNALGAVGSATPVINLIINIFLGLSTAANIVVANKIGARDSEGVSKTVHTAITSCIVIGVSVACLGVAFTENLLRLTNVPTDVAKLAKIYLRIYFTGTPGMFIYNFGSAILYATGDVKRPTIYLVLSGLINVILNIVFVTQFKMSVSGVAYATVISQYLSATFVLKALINEEACIKLCVKKMRIYKGELLKLIRIGIPASFQSILVATSNVIVQACINKCGSDAIAGSSAANNIESIIYMALYSFLQASMTFTGQNCGAGNFKRVRKGFVCALAVVASVGVVITRTAILFSEELLGMFSASDAVIYAGIQRMNIVCAWYFMYGIAETANGALRGLGATGKAVAAGLAGDCAVRLGMVMFGMPYRSLEDLNILFYSFPVSWTVTGGVMIILFFLEVKKKEGEYGFKKMV